MFFDLNLTLDPINPQLFLCKPDLNRTTIGKLNEAYNVTFQIRLGGINELNFNLPYEIENKSNINTENIRNRYLIKMVVGNYSEWFIIQKPSEHMEEEKDYKTINCFSLGFEIAQKIIRGYVATSYTATEVLNDALSGTIWNLPPGGIPAEFDLIHRSFEVSEKTALDFIFDIAETFGAVIIWNTEKREITLRRMENVGLNRGLKIKYGRYLKSLEYEPDDENFCTRLYIYGKDGLVINSVNPTGQPYIENFSYYLYPFERDPVTKETIQSSYYMSDSLAHAILDYQDFIENKTGIFESYLANKKLKQSEITDEQNILAELQTELSIILDDLDIANSTGQSNSTIISQRDAKIDEIDDQLLVISGIQSEIDSINDDIATLRSEIAIENNFTPEQIIERNQFIVWKSATNQYIFDADDLYEWGKEQFEFYKEPQLVLRIDIVNFLEVVECQYDWDKLNIGDIITIEYEKLGINVEAKIIEALFDYENATVSLTIANIRKVDSEIDKFSDKLNQGVSVSAAVSMDKYKWNEAVVATNDVQQILDNVWDAAAREIASAVNQTVEISRRGIRVIDYEDPDRYIHITNGVIGMTEDNSNSWKMCITPSGVYSQRLIGSIIAGVNLTITTGSQDNPDLDPFFHVDEYGVKITDLDLIITRSDDLFRIFMNATDGIKLQKGTRDSEWTSPTDLFWADINTGDLHLKNIYINLDGQDNISLTPNDGIIINRGNLNRIWMDINDGIKIQKKDFDDWENQLYLDLDGNLNLKGNITMNGGYINWENINAPSSFEIELPSYIKPTYIDQAKIWSPKLHSGDIFVYDVKSGTYEPGVNFPSDIPYEKKIHIGEIKPNVWGMEVFGENYNTMIDEFGINPKFLRNRPNVIRNSEGEQHDPSTMKPYYWTGDAVVTPDSFFSGSVSFLLNPGDVLEQGVYEGTDTNAGPDPAWWGNEQTRCAFRLYGATGGVCRVMIKKYSNNSTYTLYDNSGSELVSGEHEEDGIVYGEYLDYELGYWEQNTFYFFPDVGGGRVKFYFENVGTGNIRIDCIDMHEDFNGKWPFLYMPGPNSSSLTETVGVATDAIEEYISKIEEYMEYTVAAWNKDGVQYIYVQEYTEEPSVYIGLQGEGIENELATYNFIMVAEHIKNAMGNYIGVKVYPQGTSIPITFSGKITIHSICKGLVGEEEGNGENGNNGGNE